PDRPLPLPLPGSYRHAGAQQGRLPCHLPRRARRHRQGAAGERVEPVPRAGSGAAVQLRGLRGGVHVIPGARQAQVQPPQASAHRRAPHHRAGVRRWWVGDERGGVLGREQRRPASVHRLRAGLHDRAGARRAQALPLLGRHLRVHDHVRLRVGVLRCAEELRPEPAADAGECRGFVSVKLKTEEEEVQSPLPTKKLRLLL
ncbi:hypothetical protein CFC21_017022, partial [Triticum aestivum]